MRTLRSTLLGHRQLGVLFVGLVCALLLAWPSASQAAPAAGGPADPGTDTSSTSGSQTRKAPGGQRWDWSTPKQVSTDYPATFVALSCGSPTFCMAADDGGFYYRWNGRTWSLYNHSGFHTDDPTNSSWVSGLSCASADFCASVVTSASEVGPPWGVVEFLPRNGVPDPQYINDWSSSEVSCTSATNCLATSGPFAMEGWARWDGTGWQVHETPFISYSSLTCASANLCLALDIKGVARFDGTSWVDELALPPSTVSCTSTALCLAIGSDGVTRRFTGSEWAVAPTPPVGGQLSCASPTSCTDYSTSSYSVYNGSTWSAPVAVPPAPITGLLSCAGLFCAAAEGNQLAQFNGHRWSRVTTVGDDPFPLTNVSCATRRSCVGVGTYSAHQFTPAGQVSWTELDVVKAPRSAITDVSCVTTTFCVATTGQWYVSRGGPVIHVFDGSNWKAVIPDSWDELRHPEAVSCASTRFCVIVGGSSFIWWEEGQEDPGQTAVFDGVSWRWSESPRFTRVSCVSARFCMATGKVDGRSVSSVFNGTTWSTPAPFVDGTGKAPASVACTSTRYCVAIDTDGRAATYRNGRWSAFAAVAAAGPLVAASCHGRSTCLAVSSTGNVVQSRGARWSRPRHLKGLTTPVDISCPSATACVVVDSSGQAVFGRI